MVLAIIMAKLMSTLRMLYQESTHVGRYGQMVVAMVLAIMTT